MPVNFNLKSKTNKKTAIIAVVWVKGKKIKVATGESVNPDFWKSNQRTSEGKKHPEGKSINNRLEKIEEDLKAAESYFKDVGKTPAPAEFREKYEEIKNGTKPSTDINFIDYLQNFIDNSSFEYETLKKYKTALNKLIDWQAHTGRVLNFDNIDIHFYRDFEKWFYSLIKDEKTGEHFSSNYFGSLIKIIKKMMSQARADGLTAATGDRHKDFKVPAETADTIYLTVDELKKIHSLELTFDTLKKHYPKLRAQNINKKLDSYRYVKDLFLIGAFTGLRVSDFSRLDDIHVQKQYISIRTKKTGQKIIVPMHNIIKDIIKNGFDFSRRISDVKINKQIKKICEIADINDKIEVTTTRAGKKVSTIYEKWQLVTTHTARRSAATNMYKAGIPPISIMKITGHTSEASFMKYIKISQEENAELLMNHSFFNT